MTRSGQGPEQENLEVRYEVASHTVAGAHGKILTKVTSLNLSVFIARARHSVKARSAIQQ
jgi:hypothetical protein